ncbi:hypothetical protein [uncultured Sphingomonas sp.]|uniref:hypothetical protein n=1 Tax=uncultured Sphingomonas sp. TaxID=158754 RepID=UPI0025D5BEB3|nr:hypothetical protein [uncultured Sphingomonas sp.]
MTEQSNATMVSKVAEQDHAAARADATMKALLLVNGGAMIALFTFVGNVMTRSAGQPAFEPGNLRWSFGAFVVGLVLALLTHALAFLSQQEALYASAKEAWRHQRIMAAGEWEDLAANELQHFRRFTTLYAAAFGLALLSVTAFTLGCWFALNGVLA